MAHRAFCTGSRMEYMISKFDLIKYFNELAFKKGAEIGVSEGYFSEAICKAIPGVQLYCIDNWWPYHGNRWGKGMDTNNHYFETAKKRLTPYNATLIRKKSMDAVREFEENSLDFVFIDANHSYDYVMQDLIEWTKRVKPGGIVSGDDYYHFRGAGVVDAANNYALAHGITLQFTDPYSKNVIDRNALEQPCFYFFKS